MTGLAGGALLMNSTDTAKASVSMGSLNLGSDSVTTKDGTISGVNATVSGKWQYELPGGDVDHWRTQLRVSDGESWATVGETTGNVEYNRYNDEYTVSGSITDTELFDPSFFSAPGPGKQKVVELPFEVLFQVHTSDETVLANASITDRAKVTVAQESINASLYGELRGEGSINIQN